MTKYCSKGDKAKVVYGFGGTMSRSYTSSKCPIDITINDSGGYPSKSFSFDFGWNSRGASFNFQCPPPQGIPKNWNAWIISGFFDNYGQVGAVSIPDKGTYGGTRYTEPPQNCGNAWGISGTCNEAGYPDKDDKSPTYCSFTLEYRPPSNEPQSEIKITDASGQTFTDRGKSPCKFKVQCGNNCPEGQAKVDQPGYPGYCCIDCKALAAQVQAISNQIGVK